MYINRNLVYELLSSNTQYISRTGYGFRFTVKIIPLPYSDKSEYLEPPGYTYRRAWFSQLTPYQYRIWLSDMWGHSATYFIARLDKQVNSLPPLQRYLHKDGMLYYIDSIIVPILPNNHVGSLVDNLPPIEQWESCEFDVENLNEYIFHIKYR